jgi:hypothetical protein
MAICIEIPADIERQLRAALDNPEQAAKETFLVELYRQRKLTHHQLCEALGISRLEADDLLKQHHVYYDLTGDDVVRESEGLRQLREDNGDRQ